MRDARRVKRRRSERSGGFPADCDVLIAGGGPVGATLGARRCAAAGCTVVPGRTAGRSAAGPLRPIALSHGSRLILERVGAFDRIAATPIETIHVSQAGGFGRTLIERDDHGLPALGYVTDVSQVAAVLLGRGGTRADVTGRVAAWRAEGRTRQHHGAIAATRASAGSATRAARARRRRADSPATTSRCGTTARRRSWPASAPSACSRGSGVGALHAGRSARAAAVRRTATPRYYALVWTVRGRRGAGARRSCPTTRFLAALGERFGRRLGRFPPAGRARAIRCGSGSGARATPGRVRSRSATPRRRCTRSPARD